MLRIITKLILASRLSNITDFFKAIFQAIHLDDTQQGAFRIMIIGLILMLLMVLRPQGILGKKAELTLGR